MHILLALGLLIPSSFGAISQKVQRALTEKARALGAQEKTIQLAFDHFELNEKLISNKRYISVIDFDQPSWEKRWYKMDLERVEVERFLVAHGKGSDRDHDGYAEEFSNEPGSNMSSLGFYLTAETYQGGNGYSLRLDGLEKSNDQARPRLVVVHGASYVSEEMRPLGRSLGCPAVEEKHTRRLIDELKFGSLLFIYQRQYQ